MPNNDEAQIDYHKELLTSLREREKMNNTLLISLLSAVFGPLVILINQEKFEGYFFECLVFSLIAAAFVFWWGTNHIIAQSYHYRNLQKGLTKIQKDLKISLPKQWKLKGDSNKKEVLTEFYKPHYYAFIVGFCITGLTSFLLILLYSKSYSYVQGIILIAGFASIIKRFRQLQNKLNK